MSCTAIQLFDHAKVCAQACNDEPSQRAALNRLYYSAFHACVEFHDHLKAPGSVGKASGIHEQLISQLDNPTIPKGPEYWVSKSLSKSLRMVLNNRVLADYRLDFEVTADTIKESMAHCGVIMTKCYPSATEQVASAGS